MSLSKCVLAIRITDSEQGEPPLTWNRRSRLRQWLAEKLKMHVGVAISTADNTHTNMQPSLGGSCQALPLFFCSMASCFSRVSLSSRSLNSSIFSSVFSSCTCFSWARALSIATLSSPCTPTHAWACIRGGEKKEGRGGSRERRVIGTI